MAVHGNSPEVVLHCAGSGTVAHSYQSPASDFDRSITTTLAALEFMREQPRQTCFVLASSAAVYGDQGHLDIVEQAPLNPISPYGFHKMMAEQLCESYQRFFDINTRIVRLFSVYGESLKKQLLWDAANKFSHGKNMFFGTGEEMRDWIHVEDAAHLLALAATAPTKKHVIYNGGHTKATTRQVLNVLARASGVTDEPQFSGEVHAGNPMRLTADTSRAFNDLGFVGRVQLETGLHRYAEWFLAQSSVSP